MYHYFIGIDMGKHEFFAACYGIQKTSTYTNNPQGFKAFQKEFSKKLTQALVILETTGGYEMSLIRFLQAKKYQIHRANTRKVKHFIRL